MLNKTSVELAKRFLPDELPVVRGGDMLLGFEEMKEKQHIVALKLYEAKTNQSLAANVLNLASSIKELGKDKAEKMASGALSFANRRDGIFIPHEPKVTTPEHIASFPKQGIIFERRKAA